MPAISTGTGLIDPQVVLDSATVREGETVADLGCGALGHFVFPAARQVGRAGKVYAVDILRSALQHITSRMRLEGTVTIETVWGDIERPHGTAIADATLDVALVLNNLSLAREPSNIGREAFRMLKSGGRLVLVDWKLSSAPLGPPSARRVPEEAARLAMQGVGFRFMHAFAPGIYHYGMVFQKP